MHRLKHPSYVEGCYSCRLLTVGISAHALATKGAPVVGIDLKESQWQKDHQAYRNLRKEGLQPKQLDGASAVERNATHPLEVQMGHALPKEQIELMEAA